MALLFFLVTITPHVAAKSKVVLLAAHRDGWIEIYDADSLTPITRIQVRPMANSVTASPSGHTLFVAQATPSRPNACCALYAVDLVHRSMSLLIEPAMAAVISFRGDRVFTQRGNVGVEVFDGTTLERLSILRSHASYSLHPSPDGRWLFGVTYSGDILTRDRWEGPGLHIFDLQRSERVRRLALPCPPADGGWIGNVFYLVGFDGKTGHVWRTTPDMTALDRGQDFRLPGLALGPKDSILLTTFAAGGHLFAYERFGTKLDRRRGGRQISGGVYELDPVTAQVVQRLAPELHFAQIIASPDGRTLYGISLDKPEWNSPQLVALDLGSGRVVVRRELSSDEWSLDVGNLPSELLSPPEISISVH